MVQQDGFVAWTSEKKVDYVVIAPVPIGASRFNDVDRVEDHDNIYLEHHAWFIYVWSACRIGLRLDTWLV